MVLDDSQHAARSAARIVNRKDSALFADALFIAGQKKAGHQADNIAGGEMFARIFVQRFVKLPNQLLEDRAHEGVIYPIGVKVDIFEALQDLEEQPGFVQLGDGVVEVEFLQYLAHVGAEAADVIAQVGGHVGRVTQKFFKIVAGGVKESVA